MKKWLVPVIGMLLLTGMAGCARPAKTPTAQAAPSAVPAPAATTAPTPGKPVDLGADLKENVENFVKRYQATGHRTLDHLTVIQENIVQSNTDAEVTYLAQIKSRLAFGKPEDAPALKGRVAYLNDHRTEMSSDAVARAEGEIAGLRQTLQEYMDKAEDTNVRVKVKASLRANGSADPASVQVLVETFKAFETADQFTAHLPTDAAAEKEAYDTMAQNYGAKH